MKSTLLRLITLFAFIAFLSKGYEFGPDHYKFWFSLLGFLGFFGLSVWDFKIRKSNTSHSV